MRAWALALGVATVALAWVWRPLWDIDVFWHVAVGRAIRAGGIPTTDVFSAAHPEAAWSTFQWLYELLLSGLDDLAGPAGLRALHAAVIAAAVGAWAGIVRRASGSTGAALVAAAVLLVLFEDRVRARPHVFELLFVVGLVGLVRRRALGVAELAAVGLAAVWANLHAVSSLWWLALVGAWAVSLRTRRAFGILALGAVAIASAPGAWDGLAGAVASHAEWPAEFVPELRGTRVYLREGWWGMVMLLGVGAGLVSAVLLARDDDAVDVEKWTAIGCALAACGPARWAWFAAIPVGLLLVRRPPSRRAAAALIAACVVVAGARAGGRWSLDERFDVLQRDRFPVAACDFLERTGVPAGIDTTGAWSGYALYRLWPTSTVLADGRLVFGPDVADLLRRRTGDASTFDEAVGRFRTGVLLWPTGAVPPLDPSRWRRMYADPVAEVWWPSPMWTPANLEAARTASQ